MRFFLLLLSFLLLATFSVAGATGSFAADGDAASRAGHPSRKSKRMAPTESMGIDLSVESRAADVKSEGFVSSAHAAEAPPLPQQTAKKKAAPARRVRRARAAPVLKTMPSNDALASAKSFLDAKAWGKAVAVYDKVLKRDPKNKAALEGKVFALDQSGSDAALDALDNVVGRYPSFAPAHAARARILVRQNDTVEALDAWRRAVALDPENKDYRLGLAVLTDRLGHEAEALHLYQGISNLSPEAQRRRDYLAGQAGAR